MIYFIRAGDTTHVKVGFAAYRHIRLAELQCGNPLPLHLEAAIPGSRLEEKQLHRRLAEFHVQGEWFNLTVEQVKGAAGSLLPALREAPKPPCLAEMEQQAVALLIDTLFPRRQSWPPALQEKVERTLSVFLQQPKRRAALNETLRTLDTLEAKVEEKRKEFDVELAKWQAEKVERALYLAKLEDPTE